MTSILLISELFYIKHEGTGYVTLRNEGCKRKEMLVFDFKLRKEEGNNLFTFLWEMNINNTLRFKIYSAYSSMYPSSLHSSAFFFSLSLF